jgi:mRNA interferase MazF
LAEPFGSDPGYRRPIVIVQSDAFNRSNIRTVVCVPLTSNMLLAEAPGNVILAEDLTGLPKDSVASVSQMVPIDKRSLTERMGKLPEAKMQLILNGIGIVLGKKDRTSVVGVVKESPCFEVPCLPNAYARQYNYAGAANDHVRADRQKKR